MVAVAAVMVAACGSTPAKPVPVSPLPSPSAIPPAHPLSPRNVHVFSRVRDALAPLDKYMSPPRLQAQVLREGTDFTLVSAAVPTVGETFTTSNGTWTNSPSSFTYQWERCNNSGTGCVNETGSSTSQSYVVVAGDVGDTIVVVVTAHNAAGTGSEASGATGVVTTGSSSSFSISVNNTTGQLVNQNGTPTQLYGVDETGLENACELGDGFAWEPLTLPHAEAIGTGLSTSWHANAVRIILNEACWLNIDGVNSAYAGANYQNAVKSWVADLNSAGVYVILGLQFVVPPTAGTALQAGGQWPLPDAANESGTTGFWYEVAAAFKADPAVVFDTYGEPSYGQNSATAADWVCWLSGCTITAPMSACETGCTDTGSYTYATEGEQEMVTAIRAAGANQPIMIEPLNWGADWCTSECTPSVSNSSSGFYYMPGGQYSSHGGTDLTDPDNQLFISIHVYYGKDCDYSGTPDPCWAATLAEANALKLPFVVGENGSDDNVTNQDGFMSWAISNDVGFTTWSWQPDNCDTGSCPGSGWTVASNDLGTVDTGNNGSTVQADIRSGISTNG